MPREPITRETAEKLIADCHDSPTAASAKASYNAGWSLYFALNDKEEREIAEGLESSYQLFAAAVPIFEEMKMGLKAGKARVGHSMLGGTLNHEGVSRDSALKALEWLKPLPISDKENCKWLMQAWRAMGESGATEEEQMAACSHGLSVFRHMEKTWGADDRWTRYEALFYRSIGRIWARHRPKTKESLAKAEEYLKKALDTFERIEDEKSKGSMAKALRELARVCRSWSKFLRESDPKAAKRYLDRAETILRQSMEMNAENDTPSQWENYHLAKILRDRGQLEPALEECLKAVAIMESGREIYSTDDSRIGYQKGKLGIYDLGVCLAHQLDRPELGLELSQRCKARVFIEQLRSRTNDDAKAKPQAVLTAKQLSARLAEGELLLDYHLGRHALSIFAVSNKGLAARRIEMAPAALTAKVGQIKGFLRQAQTDKNLQVFHWALKRLAQDLIAPVADEIDAASCLHVVPSGALIDVPFAALPLADGKPLLERLPVSYLPHASMLAASGRTRPSRKGLLALANPTGGLAHAEEEAAEIAKVFPGAKVFVGTEANKEALALCRHCGLLHIACHGEFSPEDALGSHLILAAHDGDDGLLRVEEIVGLPLAGLDLAFLSCCKTGQGRHRGCDEVESVHRAFLMAGARSVVVTLWDIEDAVARRLVTAFYKHLAEGKRKAEALRQAQLAVMRAHPHPYHWAAFKLVGSAE